MSPLATPDPDEQVRRLLADARHDEPVPADVAARLDAVVASLQAERSVAPESPADLEAPADLAARRRRHRARALLVAAAAVAVVTLGVTHLDDLTSGTGDASSAGGSVASDKALDSPRPARSPEAEADSLRALGRLPEPVRLSSTAFAGQVHALLRPARVAALAGQKAQDYDNGTLDSAGARGARCAAPGRGVRVAATYDGARAVLVVRPARDGVRRADLYQCGEPAPVRSVRLPVR